MVLEGAGRSSYNGETDTAFKVFKSHSNSLYIVKHAYKKIPVLLPKFPVSAELPGPLIDHYQLHFTTQQITFLPQNLIYNVDRDYFSTVPNKSTFTVYFQHILTRT